jgi:hypothetical protein
VLWQSFTWPEGAVTKIWKAVNAKKSIKEEKKEGKKRKQCIRDFVGVVYNVERLYMRCGSAFDDIENTYHTRCV